MVWSSPPKTQPSPSYNAKLSNRNVSGITSTSTSTYQDSYTRGISNNAPPQTKTPTTLGHLQNRPHSVQVQGRPTTASSFTTSSSYMMSDHQSQIDFRSPTPSVDDHEDDEEAFRSRSPTPIPRMRGMLPSPPQDPSAFSSQRTDESYTIPSAQPQTPDIPYSPQVFSSSSAAASLPSPPTSQEPKPFYHEPIPSTPRLPYPQTVRPQRTIQNTRTNVPRPYTSPNAPKPYTSPQTVRARRISRDVTVIPPTPESDDSELMSSVLEGIGRMHVTMDKDDAGRWRIKRAGNGRY